MLAKVYGVEEEMIDNKRGRADRGADLICRFIDPLGLEHSIAVQVKMGGGQYSWEKAFNQIDRVASGEDHITAAVIMDIDEKPSDIEERRTDLEAKLNIPISLIAGNDFARLILTNFPRLSMEILGSDS